MDKVFEDYFNAGLCDDLQDPEQFMDYAKHRRWTLFEYYLEGIKSLEFCYGDKVPRRYADWFDFLDSLLLHAENHFMGRFGKEW